MGTDPNTIASYTKNAEAYNAHVINPQESIYHAYYEKPAIRAELPNLEGKAVLSIGCGSGVDSQYLKDNNANYVAGVDISDGMIEIAKREHPGIDFSVMDMEKLDFADESFDIAYSSLAIHYLDNWTTSLKEVHRILKPGGLYIFSCAHPIDGIVSYKQNGHEKSAILGKKTFDDSNEYEIYGDYLAISDQGVKKLAGGLSSVEVVTYHQTMENMVKYIIESNFYIQKLVEPQPLEEMREISALNYDLLTKIPAFMIWVLRK